jgi:hypothetical protein
LDSDDIDSDSEGRSRDDGEEKAMHIPFRKTTSGIMWFKCSICVEEEYDSEAKVVHHGLEVIKQDAGMPDMVERHLQVLQARRR